MVLSTIPTQQETFNAPYEGIGEYLSDNERIVHKIPPTATYMFQTGEPVLKQWGAANAEYVFMAQGPLRPGEIGYLVRNFKAKFPANLSANIIQGAELYWDEDYQVVSLAADVTNGFRIGYADIALPPNYKDSGIVLDGNGRIICGTSDSDFIVVQSQDSASTTKGTVTIY